MEQFKPRIKTPKQPTEIAKIVEQRNPSPRNVPPKSPMLSMLPDNDDEMAKAKLLFALIMNNKKHTSPPPINEDEHIEPQINTNLPRMDISFPPYKSFTTYSLFAENDLPKPTSTIVSTQNIHNDFHNNYMFEFPNDLHIDNHMEISNYNFPKRTTNNITEKNNKFYINKELITVPCGYYNRYTLTDQINRFLPNSITCILDDDMFVTFKSTDNSKFMLIEESLLLFLGYRKQSYVNSTSYTAEKEIGIGDNVFPITIKNVCEDEPLFIINMDANMDANTVTKTKTIFTPTNVDYFDVKIHIENNLNNEFFFKQPHELTFVTY